ncbi:MAG: hypothetical protein M1511_17980 [Deltaproteobacteria bacterium]|nr:hypothetical protein [Deltaproteobacteria bacterium]
MRKDEQDILLESLSAIFGTCFLLTLALLLLWFIFYFVGGDWGYRITSNWFDVSRHDYDLMSYFGITFVKICNILFFLFPYLSIRLLLRKKEMNR